jgi:hypothetical protein
MKALRDCQARGRYNAVMKRRCGGAAQSYAKVSGGSLRYLDVRYGTRDGSACAEFSWEGNDESDPASGRGWVVLGTAGRLVGHFYIHNGDDSAFVCDRA